MNGPNVPKAHFVLVPLVAQGHMIPMVDAARMLAERGVLVTFITTPVNAARMKTTIDHVNRSGLPIHFVELPFPCAEVGLPDGCENVDQVSSTDSFLKLFEALRILRRPLELCLRERPRPSCMISDMCNPWTMHVARELGIPRIVFHGPSCFYLLCSHMLQVHNVYERVTDVREPVLVPDMPHPVETTTANTPGWFDSPGYEKLRYEVIEAESTADGVVMNTFDDLEHSYIDCYKRTMGKKMWAIGPLCLYNKDLTSKATRGNEAAIDADRILSWLDSMETNSVIYVSFGSSTRTRPAQIIEIGTGLEASQQPFIWVIKEVEKSPEVEQWLAEGFEERTSAKGVIIKGWAPQTAILSHPAVGGFLTHCGWNSILEAVSAGAPMVTWPHFLDQFCNERLIVEILKIGISIGVKMPSFFWTEDVVAVKRDDIEQAVRRLMDQGEEGTERRARAKELAEKARKATEEGGSSYENLTHLIEYFSEHASKDMEDKQVLE